MTTRYYLHHLKRHGMINSVTFKVIARKHGRGNTVSLNAQCHINRERVVVPLSIYIDGKLFDSAKELVKVQHEQNIQYNAIISNARDRVATILSDANKKNIKLSRTTFRERFTTTLSDVDLIEFWRLELTNRKGGIEHSTWKQQSASFRKFTEFKKSLPFDTVTVETIETYVLFLRRKGNQLGTIAAALKNFKAIINTAIRRGVEIKNPFMHYKIRQAPGRIVFLTIPELHSLVELYDKRELSAHLNESLLTFLVQSFTSLLLST